MPEPADISADDLDPGARLIVDLDALAANYRFVRTQGSACTAGVVKADAYGFGAAAVVPALAAAGCEAFFTAFTSEAVEVRRLLPRAEVFVMSPLMPADVPALILHRLIPCLYDRPQVRMWADACGARPRACAIHAETGINRLGMPPEEVCALAADVDLRARIEVNLIMGHLASGDEPDAVANAEQLARFRDIRGLFPEARASLANSAGVFLGRDFHFDVVRPGIALYGHHPHDPPGGGGIRPVATLETRVAQVKWIRAGEAVGYGGVSICERDTRIGVVPLGYADGVSRAISPTAEGGGHVCRLASGHPAPVIGRVSMDMVVLDLSAAPEDAARTGARVEVFGGNVPVECLAERAGTIPYEVFCGIGSRVRRVYRGEAAPRVVPAPDQPGPVGT